MTTHDITKRPGAFRARKRPIPVTVVFTNTPGWLKTLEGDVSFEADDAILTGVEGEQWPLSREKFLSTYKPITPTKIGDPGNYRKQPLVVWAWRTDAPTDIALSEVLGFLHAEPGDYIVQYGSGDLAVVGASIFEKTYEPIS